MDAFTRLARLIDNVNEYVGRGIAWLALLMVVVQFTVVVLRYVFAIGFIPMQESIWYLHGILFMAGAGYTLLHDGHVRVDVFYREASPRWKALVDLFGVIFFLLPVMALSWWLSWPYVANAWRIKEGSTEVSGLPFIYLLKAVLLVFVALLTIQGIAIAIRSTLRLAGREVEEPEHHKAI